MNALRRWLRLPKLVAPANFFVLVIGLIGLVFTSLLILRMPSLAQVPVAQESSAQGDRSEIRGVWITNVDSNLLYSSASLSKAIQELAQVNINTIYPEVWNWGYTPYPSAVLQTAIGAAFDPRPSGLENRDVLAEMVTLAHQRGIAVLPWFEFGFMAPEDSALALRHPDWLTKRQDNFQPPNSEKCPCSSRDPRVWMEGIYPRVWLNPFKPEVQQFIRDLILEIVTRYDIDGIQFDDHFGLPVEFGYDEFTIQLYRNEHQGKAPPSNVNDLEWMRWRANKITEFLTKVFREIKARKNSVLVALSPNNYSFAYNHSLQDWRSWQSQGLLEELILQVYRDSPTAFLNELNAPEVQAARRHIPTAVGVLTGLRQKFVPIKQVQDQVQLIRKQKFAGVSFFFYETLWNLVNQPTEIRKAGFKTLFPTPVTRPNVIQGWKPTT